jgi:hypothetical protein
MYYPLVYILSYIKKSDAVSPKIGLQLQVNDGISQLLADDHNNEQNQDDVVSSNNQQDMSVNENVIQVNGTNICNQGVPKQNVRITNADRSSVNNNANVNPRVQQTNRTVINVDDDELNTDDDTCALCLQAIRSDADRGYDDTDEHCRCLHDYHYHCLMAMHNTNTSSHGVRAYTRILSKYLSVRLFVCLFVCLSPWDHCGEC